MRPRATDTPLAGLYAITPDVADTARLLGLVEAALRGGAALIQYRNKSASDALRREQAAGLRALCRHHGRALIINDDAALAHAVDAEGVHLGRDDGDLIKARATLGPGKIIGVSCYNDLPRAERASEQGADYLAFGAMFASSTKPEAVSAPLDTLRAARRLGKPLAAIGGITLANAASVIDAGADMLAVISDLFTAPDIAAQAAAFTALIESPRT